VGHARSPDHVPAHRLALTSRPVRASHDFILTEDSEPYVLEVNSTPGMSRDSNFAVGAAMVGLTHTDVVLAMLHEALARPPYDVPLPTPAFSSTTPLTREAAVSP
jgi:D-alanine-D-alanine ligase